MTRARDEEIRWPRLPRTCMGAATVIVISMALALAVAFWVWLDSEDIRRTVRAWLLASSLLTLSAIFVYSIAGRVLFRKVLPKEPPDS